MSLDQSSPIVIDTKSPKLVGTLAVANISLFDSYTFDKNILVPASAFRFTAPGVDKNVRMAIRSGDLAALYAIGLDGKKWPLGTGIVDETDCHITPTRVEYVLSGRDMLGQLIDNAAVDADSKIINTKDVTLQTFMGQLLANTRMPQGFINQQVPNGKLLVNTSPGETKINSLQRYLEFMNCLVWCNSQGQAVLGKPNFAQEKAGFLTLGYSNPSLNNLLECRVRRNLNQAVRKQVTQLQTMDQVDAGTFTVFNQDPDVKNRASSGVGISRYNRFSYGSGNDVVNQIAFVGNQAGSPQAIGAAYSRREIARENVKVLDVEAVVRNHLNENGVPYNIDQIYNVQIEDEDVYEDMYVYACSYEMTMQTGSLTRLRLCRVGTTLVDGADYTPRST